MFTRIGRLAVRHPWRVIGAWLAIAAAVIAFSPTIDSVVNEDDTAFVPDHYESVRADHAAEAAFPEARGTDALIVFKRADGARLTSADARHVAAVAAHLEKAGIDRVAGVETSAQAVSPSHDLQLAHVRLRGEETDERVQQAVEDLRTETSAALASTGLKAGMTGAAAIRHDFNDSVDQAEATVGIATVILIVVLMGLIFRSPVVALLPIVLVGLVSKVANGLIADSAELLGYEADFTLPILLIVVLFGIGTDYILFVLFRYRERLRLGDDPREAVVFAVGRVGEAVASSALVVVAAFCALVFSSLESNATLGPSLAIAVVVMVAAALTLVPAVIALLGPRLFWPSKAWQQEPRDRFVGRFARALVRRPLAFVGGSLAVLAVLAIAVTQVTPNYDQLSAVPADKEAKRAYEDVARSLPPGAVAPTDIVVKGRERLRDGELAELVGDVRDVKGVQAVSPPQLSNDGRTARVQAMLAVSPNSPEGLDILEQRLRPVAAASSAGDVVLVGGQSAANVELRAATEDDRPVVYPIAAAAIALILALLLRSLIAPWFLLLSVGLGFAATLGATELVFQEAGGEPGLTFKLPILVYLFVVAIGTDYNIILTARVREEVADGRSTREAVAEAIRHTGPTVAAAALILAGTFASLMLSGVSSFVQIGFAVSIGIVMSAFLLGLMMVPALTARLGDRVWWPTRRASAPPVPALPAGGVAFRAGDSIENAVTGERIVFVRTAAETGGEVCEVETVLRPGGFVASAHVHPGQEERFRVLEGRVGFRAGRERLEVGPGGTIAVPPGTPHRFWNAGATEARFVCEVRPALHFEQLLDTMFGLAAAGKTNRKGLPNLLRLAVIAQAFGDTIRLPWPPVWVQRAGLAVLAPIGRALGYRAEPPRHRAPLDAAWRPQEAH